MIHFGELVCGWERGTDHRPQSDATMPMTLVLNWTSALNR
jgi:hypothetical protein